MWTASGLRFLHLGGLVATICICLSIVAVWKQFSWGGLFGGLFLFGLLGSVVWLIVGAIVKGIFGSKKKTASELNLKKPPALIWKAVEPRTEIVPTAP
jgi:uncharacterized membrane protein